MVITLKWRANECAGVWDVNKNSAKRKVSFLSKTPSRLRCRMKFIMHAGRKIFLKLTFLNYPHTLSV